MAGVPFIMAIPSSRTSVASMSNANGAVRESQPVSRGRVGAFTHGAV